MAKYKCSVCGYIYDEEKEGQPLLDSKCPVCGMTMVLMEENDSEAAASTALEADAAPEELAYDPAYARCDASCRYMDDIHEMAVTGKSIIGAMGTPMPMLTFLEQYDLSGKTIVPFVTHGGGGVANCVSDLKKAVPGATVLDALVVSGGSAQNAQSDVSAWLKRLGLVK